MIKYQLVCRKEHRFEGWFASSAAFDEQSAKGSLTCPSCNSRKITKAPMAPSVPKSTEQPTPAQIRQALVALRQHVEGNAENVGTRFADEARAIHYGDSAERPIYGDATPEETKDLTEEGIEVGLIPWISVGDA